MYAGVRGCTEVCDLCGELPHGYSQVMQLGTVPIVVGVLEAEAPRLFCLM